jgi:hypothetical protein
MHHGHPCRWADPVCARVATLLGRNATLAATYELPADSYGQVGHFMCPSPAADFALDGKQVKG